MKRTAKPYKQLYILTSKMKWTSSSENTNYPNFSYENTCEEEIEGMYFNTVKAIHDKS
jgi:hypothetical protein